jgi:AAA domain-containing protein
MSEARCFTLAENSKRAGPSVPVPGVLASEVKPEDVKWLWENRIPLGKVTIFDGDPDLGKSAVALDLAARVTNGWPMPDGADPGYPPAGAVIVSLEDGVADTIRPRLEAAGAVLEKVRIVTTIKGAEGTERTPTLPVDLPAIEAAIHSVSAELVVLDPLVAMLAAKTDSFRDQDIRRVLAPVAALAEKTGVAVVCIRHLNKAGGQNPKYRGGGSIGIIGAARAAFLFGEKPREEGRYVFAPVKGNLWRRKPSALEYSIEDQGGQPVIAWCGASVHTAASLLAQPESAEESNARAEAKRFLSEFLADGPRAVGEIKSEAGRAEISERTLVRARSQLGIRAEKVGFGGGQHWQWGLPKNASPPAKEATFGKLASFEQVTETKPDVSTPLPKSANSTSLASFGAGEEVSCSA